MGQRGEIDIDERERLAGGLGGAPAATSQVTGIAYFSAQGWSLRVGRGDHGPLRLFDPHEPDADAGRLVQAMKDGSGTIWEGIFWVPTLRQPHLAVSTPVYRDGSYAGVITSAVSVRALSHFVEIGRASCRERVCQSV